MKILYLITMSNGELYNYVRNDPLNIEELSKQRWLKMIMNNSVCYLNIAHILSMDMREIPEGDE